MVDYKMEFKETIGVSDSLSGVVRKVVEPSTQDLVVARFWVQNFRILERSKLDVDTRGKVEKVLTKLAEDMLGLRGDIMAYSAEVSRYFEGVKSGEFYEVKENIEYFKEVFHGKTLAENFYFHASLCLRDALRLMRLTLPNASTLSWEKLYAVIRLDRANLARLTNSLDMHWENLLVIRGIRGVIEHSDNEKDFDITEIKLEKTEKGIAFHQPYLMYPESINLKLLDGTNKTIKVKDTTLLDLMDTHFWAIFNVCESVATYPLLAKLDEAWQPRLIAIQHYDKECPIQWAVEPATNPRRTVNNLPT